MEANRMSLVFTNFGLDDLEWIVIYSDGIKLRRMKGVMIFRADYNDDCSILMSAKSIPTTIHNFE